ncbi:hypothetical protein [Corallococcus sp. 4LFB]|uniref:hypothetical protein n=1 Tax=Corallococcus sp. 4LFB TaxID=3383249 RepID=UPI003974F87B
MLGTVMLDVFKKDETQQIADALDQLCSADDNYGWASTGVYSFFNPETKETLYLGLAQDLTERFRQHTGGLACDPRCCKKDKIDAYFQVNERLGFGVFVQSPLSQPVIRRKGRAGGDFEDDDLAGLDDAQYAEGLLIEAHRLAYGKFPPWNVIGGDKRGGARATQENVAVVNALSGGGDVVCCC